MPQSPATGPVESAAPPIESPAIRLPVLLEALDAAAFLFDPDGSLAAVNEAGAALFAGQREQLLGLSYDAWCEQARSVFRGSAAPLTVTRAPLAHVSERLQAGTVRRRTYERVSRPLREGDGNPAGRLELFRDVTDQVRLEEEKARAEARHAREITTLEAELAQVEKFKMELTANVSHDLRTPLASIKASVSGLLAGDVAYEPEVLRETLSVIEEETDRLQRRVGNLLSMSRMEAGDGPANRDWVDLADVATSALEALRTIRGEREVRLDFPDDLPLIQADYDQLQIAIRNLIENAFLYSPPGSPVDVSASVGLGFVRLRVRDYGPGLLPDEAERVFQKFYRGRSARRIPGTGLGLPICRGIAEAHGGHLWAEHVPGGGVVFVLSLPLEGETS